MNKNRISKNKLKKEIIKSIFLIMVYVIFTLILFCIVPKKDSDKVYTTSSYIVSSGETLWSIGTENLPEGMSIQEYIYELRKLNNIDDCIIYPGQEIQIIK